ncbi:MAG TPA: hypothetical protein VM818_16450 [Vicinamibacterales bacterium]|nr:hypothetical protein [Vicinamibacterales bacterium]
MRGAVVPLLGVVFALGCSGAGGPGPGEGGNAKVTIADTSFDVSNVRLVVVTGEDGYFRVDGDDAAHPNDDCLPGLGGGLALYGDVPANVTSGAYLAGKELPFEFTGDGDDFNLCFVGSNGLLGVESGTVRFDAVEGTTVTFSFSGSFVLYDGEGGQSSSEMRASGSGVAHLATD